MEKSNLRGQTSGAITMKNFNHHYTGAATAAYTGTGIAAAAATVINFDSYGEEYLSGLSWPPRSYTCSFCRREFRSAQALGGHMNVHRRDRARMRHSPIANTPINLNFIPNNNNDNINSSARLLSSSSPKTQPLLYRSSSPALVSPHLSSSSLSSCPADGGLLDALSLRNAGLSKERTLEVGEEGFNGLRQEDKWGALKGEIVKLDLEIGIFGDTEDELDLELRLGYK
ncbi:hypothetical protein Nepgr_021805 [Nepenthes gracilis]|uniref:C2H2-type domain-containing protein n=1 Tax=Nepenthes gracilis TaxID=150966 RepID=A0AAD3XXE7_NEPGR|nr:hypothetical protein Nepgr_021805 [Nepenthes gracilis]